MKLRKTKKGFTVVELVIVIAVIAVLAAILIPTFISLDSRAKKASDQSLVSNLNTALAAQEGEVDDTKNVTMHDAVLDLKKWGYDLDALVTRSGEDLLWNSKTNRFLLSKEAPEYDVSLWRIQKTYQGEDKYSVYAGEGFQATVTGLKVGFDAGYNEGISSISYVGVVSQQAVKEVIIRTNGGTLNVDAAADTVSHYGNVDKVAIANINSASYHEFGKVAVSMSVTNGHVVVEPNGYVNEIAVPTTSNASIDVKSNGTVNTAVVDNPSTPVTVEQGADVDQFVGDTTNVSGAGATDVKANAVTKTEVTTAEELKAAVSAGDKYVSIANDLTLSAWDSSNNVGVAVLSDLILDGNGHTLTVSAGRGIWIDADNVSLTVKNMKMVGSSSKFERAIQVCGDVKGAKLSIENFEVTNASYYAINICNNCDVDLQITNSKITGWGAVNLWSAKYSVYISNCELTGHNDKGYNAEGWNNFGTVILEGDTTGETTDHSSTIDVKIVNTKISATTSGQGNHQWCVLFNNGCTSNNVALTGCSLVYNDAENTHLFLDQGEGNNLYIDGTKVN